jgi:hypothetical protein
MSCVISGSNTCGFRSYWTDITGTSAPVASDRLVIADKVLTSGIYRPNNYIHHEKCVTFKGMMTGISWQVP